MYPDFRYIAINLFGIDDPWQWLGLFKTFGFFVAIAFIFAAWTLMKELRRKEQQGLLLPDFELRETGKPATVNELFWSALIGFVLGYKIGGFYNYWREISPDPMGYIFTLRGNVIIGIAGALLMAYMKYAEKKKQELPEPKTVRVAVYPHQRVGEIVVIAAIAGLAGAKIFNAFESWDDFIRNPAASLFSSMGLTFYGGLIMATLALYYYSRKHKIGFMHLCDAAAPGLFLAYGIGRLGCHFSGDGDWGIPNSAYITDAGGHLKLAASGEFAQTVQNAPLFFTREFGSIADVPHLYAKAPGWLPDWVFAMNYPNNVNNQGVPLTGCLGDYCSVLPSGVFPTSLYEAFTGILLFFLLWRLRKKIRKPFHLFGIYLILNGVERFFIEKIRVNYKYDWGFLHPTQAEIISAFMVLAGIAILLFVKYKPPHVEAPAPPVS